MSAPQKPVPTSATTAGGAPATTTPSTNEPTTFTVNVPHGKPVSCWDWTIRSVA